MENENERLRSRIKHLEKKVKKYQKELLILYSSGSEYKTESSRETSPYHKYRVLYIPQNPEIVPPLSNNSKHSYRAQAVWTKG